MMAIYDTYREAVIANGSTKGVVTTCEYWTGSPWFEGKFTFETKHERPAVGEGKWVKCNPANYLESLEGFLASGKRLVDGDLYIGALNGKVLTIGHDGGSANGMNCTTHDTDRKTFILQAAADQVETPEEKEVFDRIPNQTTIDAMNSEEDQESYSSASEAFDAIDTKLQQVESLNCSGKPNSAEWKNGDKVCSDGLLGVFIGLDPYSYGLCYVIEGGMDSPVLWHTNRLSKPETPAEREEREREESARELYLLSNKVMAGTHMINHYSFQESKDVWLAIVDETGYRKQ